jgi:hypothetical protein
MKLSEMIAKFREGETPLDLAVLLDDGFLAGQSKKFMSAWQTMPPIPDLEHDDKLQLPTSHAGQWDFMWMGFEPDLETLSERCGLTVSKCAQVFGILRSHRLIYPDSTIHGLVAALFDLETKRKYALALESKKATPVKRVKQGATNGSNEKKGTRQDGAKRKGHADQRRAKGDAR